MDGRVAVVLSRFSASKPAGEADVPVVATGLPPPKPGGGRGNAIVGDAPGTADAGEPGVTEGDAPGVGDTTPELERAAVVVVPGLVGKLDRVNESEFVVLALTHPTTMTDWFGGFTLVVT
jgi:hypothetical protein